MSDKLTALRAEPGRRLAKRISLDAADGLQIEAFDDKTKWHEVYEPELDGIEALAVKLDQISEDPRACVIRGEPLPGIDRMRCRRLLHEQPDGTPPSFREVPRRWLLLDFDNVPGVCPCDPLDGEVAGYWLRSKLPAAFKSASFWWQMTASAGIKPGARMRLAFWLDRAVTGAELKLWLASAPVDPSIFGAVHAIFVARPILVGLRDPIARRSGLELDFRDVVEVPEIRRPAPVPRAAGPSARHYEQRLDVYDILEDIGARVARTTEAGTNDWGGSGRHHALYCGALSASRLVREGRLPRADAELLLTRAAIAAGIRDQREIGRHIRNGLHTGGVS